MKLGLLTAAFPDSTLDEIAAWAAATGYETLEVAAWPAGSGSERRYSGVSHLDVDDPEPARAVLERHGLTFSALAYYPNNLDPDAGAREHAHEHLRKTIVAAERLGVDVVCTFVGRDPGRSEPENLALFREQWPPLVRFAADHGIRIAIENCPMFFGWDQWPGGTNLAYSPAIWRQLFEAIPDESFGLNLDPSHLVWQFIDYERAVYDFADRIFHVHAKDMEIDRDGLYEHGVMARGMGWQVPRIPGLGEVRWNRFVAALYAIGFDGAISVEHEDRRFEGDLERVEQGFEIAYRTLRPLVA